MSDSTPYRTIPADVHAALGLLSRLPLPECPAARTRGADAAWAWPVAGLMIGALAGLAGVVALAAGLPSALAALVTLTASVALSGALHEDGLADTADGFWGGWTAARRLEIMKDSHIGPYGVIALVLSLLARWAALWLLFDLGGGAALAALLAAAALSRAAMPALIWALPPARASGLGHGMSTASGRSALLALATAAIAALVLVGWSAFGAVFWAAATTIALGLVARAKIRGQTGDVLGAAQQLAEIAVLLSILT